MGLTVELTKQDLRVLVMEEIRKRIPTQIIEENQIEFYGNVEDNTRVVELTDVVAQVVLLDCGLGSGAV
jgi:hypothetical protein